MGTSTRPGQLLAERYRLIDLLSESGGGRFWRAHDRILERYVALHVVDRDDPRAREMLTAARESARVHDVRVLRVLDAATRDDLCYVVNEWGTGVSLDVLIAHRGPLGPRRSAWLTAEVSEAIATAHDAGVSHGRLNPENVLIDRFGAVKLIGLGVDAAMHGLARGRLGNDRADLAGVLYCALTGMWPGCSPSEVEPAPRDHDTVLSPRQVRAGVPRPLDDIWRAVSDQHQLRRWSGTHAGPDVASASAFRDRLLEFLGDTTGMPKTLATTILRVNELGPVDLPPVPDPVIASDDPTDHHNPPTPQSEPVTAAASATTAVADGSAATDQAASTTSAPTSPEPTEATTAGPAHEGSDEPSASTEANPADATADAPGQHPEQSGQPGQLANGITITDLPTEAGTPIFDDDDVEWFQARRTPPPPPPPFEPPPERPLFAPDPVRRPRDDVDLPPAATFGAATQLPTQPPTQLHGPPPPDDPWEPDNTPTAENPIVPGRSWLRLALLLGAVVLLFVAVAVAFNLGRGRTVLGEERSDPSVSASESSVQPPVVLKNLRADDFDPEGDDGEENSEDVAVVVDGDPGTSWITSSYRQQFGPGGLKSGVGVVLDLNRTREVTQVTVAVGDSPLTVAGYLSASAPTQSPTGDPVDDPIDDPIDKATSSDGNLSLAPRPGARGRYLTLWITRLPGTEGDYRGSIAEVIVRGR